MDTRTITAQFSPGWGAYDLSKRRAVLKRAANARNLGIEQMSENKNPTDSAIEGIAKIASDIYADVAHPAARHIGRGIETIFKVGLAPVAMLDWGFEQSKEWLQKKVEERLAQIPQDCHITPPSNIAVPILLQIAASVDAPDLRGLYAELLLKAMDVRTVSQVHPAYISVLAQMSPTEALIFLSFRNKGSEILFSQATYGSSSIEKQFEAYCNGLGLGEVVQVQVGLENLQRLGLLVIDQYSDVSLKGDDVYNSPRIDTYEHRYLSLTAFGRVFLFVCDPQGPLCEA
ncbi:MAG: DUF4393 domain-containing protein [Cytophagaceae bacterium]|nr:MAG: DUF4393 domain-containing protein [Cytophagaceae bacterium]